MTATNVTTLADVSATPAFPVKESLSLQMHPDTYRIICNGALAAQVPVADFVVTAAYRCACLGIIL